MFRGGNGSGTVGTLTIISSESELEKSRFLGGLGGGGGTTFVLTGGESVPPAVACTGSFGRGLHCCL